MRDTLSILSYVVPNRTIRRVNRIETTGGPDIVGWVRISSERHRSHCVLVLRLLEGDTMMRPIVRKSNTLNRSHSFSCVLDGHDGFFFPPSICIATKGIRREQLTFFFSQFFFLSFFPFFSTFFLLER